jgi:hypothetical protein
MDNTFIGEMTISPHIVKVGQSINIEMEVISSPEWGTPVADQPCYDASCSIKMTSPTSDWLRYPGTFCFNPRIACGTEQEAVYVLGEDEYAISGVVRDAEGKGVKGVRVDISPGFYAVTENINGFYQAILKKGTYTVSAPEGYCVRGSKPCAPSKKVVLTGATAVDFQEEETCVIFGLPATAGAEASPACHELGGRVVDENGKGLARVPVTVKNSKGKTRRLQTGSDGRYGLKTKGGAYRVSVPGDYCLSPFNEKHADCLNSLHVDLGADRTDVNFEVEAFTVTGYVWGAQHNLAREGVRLKFTRVGSKKAVEAASDGAGKLKSSTGRPLRLRHGTYSIRPLTSEYCFAGDEVLASYPELINCERTYVLSLIRPAYLEYRAELYRLGGTVAGQKGKPVENVRVEIEGLTNGFNHVNFTDAGGEYSEVVRPGRYEVSAKHPKGFLVCAKRQQGIRPCVPKATVEVTGKASQDFAVHLKTPLAIKLKPVSKSGWSIKAGKSFDPSRRNYRVGFQTLGEPAGGDFGFLWECHSGCLNLGVEVTDKVTGKPPAGEVTVHISVAMKGGEVPHGGSLTGVLCTAPTDKAFKCGQALDLTLEGGRSKLAVYYFAPGVTTQGTATITATADDGKSDDDIAVATGGVPVTPKVLFQGSGGVLQMKLSTETANSLIYLGTFRQTGAIVDQASFCGALIHSLTTAIAFGNGSGSLPKLGPIATKVREVCEAGESLLDKIPNLQEIVAVTLWAEMAKGFNFPTAGLRGTPNQVKSLVSFVLGSGDFKEALYDGLAAYLQTPGLKEPRQGDSLSLRVLELSHRQADGGIQNGLWVEVWGSRSGVETRHTAAYAGSDYVPECWLDPAKNQTYVTISNPCGAPHP